MNEALKACHEKIEFMDGRIGFLESRVLHLRAELRLAHQRLRDANRGNEKLSKRCWTALLRNADLSTENKKLQAALAEATTAPKEG